MFITKDREKKNAGAKQYLFVLINNCSETLKNANVLTFFTDNIFPILRSSLAGVTSLCSAPPFAVSTIKQ